MPYRVFIQHPERQHSHELAAALAAAGRLGAYVHGATVPAETLERIPPRYRRQIGFCPIGRRLMEPILPQRAALEAYYRSIWAFDALMARRLASDRFEAVVGYENAALHCFRKAKASGIACILDNSGVHHAVQDRWIEPSESSAFHHRIIDRKNQELDLADLVLCCSTFAAQSFIDGGVAPDKINVVPLGCDTALFSTHPRAANGHGEAIRFLFVGRIVDLKGADVLAEAAMQLAADRVPFALDVAASVTAGDPAIVSSLRPVARLLDKVAHTRLPAVYAQADCLVVPSRFDSFALVVAEALAAGTPVIVSNNVGARDMIEDGTNGWIVPAGDVVALRQRMQWCAEHVGQVRTMAAAARATAETWGWPRYHRVVVDTVDAFMAQRRDTRLRQEAGLQSA